tara:strand:+ start:153 stop:692 length:540 start_codon:yes stop_codon:yes gene_type:complete
MQKTIEYWLKGIIKVKLIFLLCLLSFDGNCGNDFEGYKFATGYGFGKQVFKLNYNRKLWEEGLFFDGNTHAFSGFFNDHISAGVDLCFGKNENNISKLFYGTEISYEANLLYVQMRVSLLSHFNNIGQFNESIRSEIGLTDIGMFSLTYGYNWTLYKSKYAFNAKHNLTFSISSSYFGY